MYRTDAQRRRVVRHELEPVIVEGRPRGDQISALVDPKNAAAILLANLENAAIAQPIRCPELGHGSGLLDCAWELQRRSRAAAHGRMGVRGRFTSTESPLERSRVRRTASAAARR
jgi:hypothetical protein